MELFHDYEKTYEIVHKDELKLQTLLDTDLAANSKIIIDDAEWLQHSAEKEEARLRAETDEIILNGEISIAAISILGLIVGLGLAWGLGSMISKPVVAMTVAMKDLSAGNLDVEVPAQNRADEVGAMAEAMQTFKESAIEQKRLEEVERQSQERREERAKYLVELTETFDSQASEIVNSVAGASAEMRSTAEAMSATAEQTSNQTTAVAAASEQATANVQTVASASEEMSASINEINRQVSQSAEITTKANAEAERTNETVQSLADAAQKIGEVVGLISEIAEQTNLLALNATIEAAPRGRGRQGLRRRGVGGQKSGNPGPRRRPTRSASRSAACSR